MKPQSVSQCPTVSKVSQVASFTRGDQYLLRGRSSVRTKVERVGTGTQCTDRVSSDLSLDDRVHGPQVSDLRVLSLVPPFIYSSRLTVSSGTGSQRKRRFTPFLCISTHHSPKSDRVPEWTNRHRLFKQDPPPRQTVRARISCSVVLWVFFGS